MQRGTITLAAGATREHRSRPGGAVSSRRGSGSSSRHWRSNRRTPTPSSSAASCATGAGCLVSRPIPSRPNKLLESAQADLEKAVKIDPSEARAWASLSHLYNHTKGPTDAKLAARRAYEEDAYLSNIDKVIDRLFYSSRTTWRSSPMRSSGATRASAVSRPITTSPCATSTCLATRGSRTRCSPRLAPPRQRRRTRAGTGAGVPQAARLRS